MIYYILIVCKFYKAIASVWREFKFRAIMRPTLALLLLLLLSGVVGAGSPGRPDPQLVPVVDDLVAGGKYEALCQLSRGLEEATALMAAVHDSRQIEDTLAYIRNSLEAKGAPRCRPSYAPESTTTPVEDENSDKEEGYEAEAAMAEEGDEQQRVLCDNCEYDEYDPETRHFVEAFDEQGEHPEAPSVLQARRKLTLLMAVSGLVAVVIIVILVAFAVLCCHKWKRRGKEVEGESEASEA